MTHAQCSDAIERDIFSNMEEGEYKVFKKFDSKELHVIIKLYDLENVIQLLVGSHYVKLITNTSKIMNINISELELDYNHATAYSWKEFVCVKIFSK